jgi:Uma2 family endonuclease
MRVIFAALPPELESQRKRTGEDMRDEMWEGLLHVPPMATNDHQDFAGQLLVYLTMYWARPRKAKAYPEVNLASIGGWKHNYRIPDLMLLSPKRYHIDKGTHFEGAPDLVVEIHSPNDEAYEKLDFYEELGVPEVWIIDRDSREPEIYLLKRGRLRKQTANAGGWLRSPTAGMEVKANRSHKLVIRLAGDDSTRAELPET